MKAVVWHGDEDIRVETVDDPRIEEPTDAIVRVTSTAICGSDLHLNGTKVIGMKSGDILGHEAMGIVEEVGSTAAGIAPGDRVVVPSNIWCGRCYMCEQVLQLQCETTRNTDTKKSASIYGYTHLYGGVPGGHAHLELPVEEKQEAVVRDAAVRDLHRRRPARDGAAPQAYAMFQKKEDGAIKVVLEPS